MIIDTSLEPAPRKPQTRTFRRSVPIVRFTPDQSRRQNDLIRGAWESLKTKEAVIAFLNTHNDALGGEPLTLALASEEGLRFAEQELGTEAAKARS
jgi:hypothetical protein